MKFIQFILCLGICHFVIFSSLVLAEKVRIGITGGPTEILLSIDLAQAQGFFKENGLEIEKVYLEETQGLAYKALRKGSMNVIISGFDQILKASDENTQIKMFLSLTHIPGFEVLVHKRNRQKIRSLKDLKNRIIGINYANSYQHLILCGMLSKKGMSKQDISFRIAGTHLKIDNNLSSYHRIDKNLLSCLEKDIVEAAIIMYPYFVKHIENGEYYSVGKTTDLKSALYATGGLYTGLGLISESDYISKNKDLIQRIVNALVKSNIRLYFSPPQKSIKSLQKIMKFDNPEFVAHLIGTYRDIYCSDGIPRGARLYLKLYSEYGVKHQNKKSLKPWDLYDVSFVKKALLKSRL